jgi:hypothetical protein
VVVRMDRSRCFEWVWVFISELELALRCLAMMLGDPCTMSTFWAAIFTTLQFLHEPIASAFACAFACA